jgi:hypothetical protein
MAEIKCLSVISINGRRLSFGYTPKRGNVYSPRKVSFRAWPLIEKNALLLCMLGAAECERERERNIPGNDSTLYAE